MKTKDKLSNVFTKLKRTKKSKFKSFDSALISLGVHQQKDSPKNEKSLIAEK